MFPNELADSIAAPAAEIAQLKDLTFDELVSTLTSKLIHFSISLAVAILVFYAGRFIITRLYTFVEKVMLKRHVEPSLTTFILSLIRIVLYFILLVTVIGILGIETSSFIAIFASAGVAIGMALSGTLQNFAGGVLILLLKPFKVGDTIEAQGFAGTVKKIEIFNTIITTPDNKTIIIPNGGLSTAPINNSTTRTTAASSGRSASAMATRPSGSVRPFSRCSTPTPTSPRLSRRVACPPRYRSLRRSTTRPSP